MIPYGRHLISDQDIEAVDAVLRSDFITQGKTVPRFEEAVASYVGAEHAVAVNSATSALHIACLALNVGPGTIVWTSPNTFVSSANCALFCGATVSFVDIDPKTYNLSVEALEEKLRIAQKTNSLPQVLIAVHYAGQPCDMVQIKKLGDKYKFRIIEDASHAIGARYQQSPSSVRADYVQEKLPAFKVGGCAHSDITVFSFHPVKIITTGEGGIATTNQHDLARSMSRYRSHGITHDQSEMFHRPDSEIWNYQQIDLGFNYRMTEIQAALGLSQMSKLDSFIELRHQIANRYDLAFEELPVETPWQQPATFSSFHLYPIGVEERFCGRTQRYVYDALIKNGIAANLHYIPVHLHPYYQTLGFKPGDYPEAESFFRKTISLPIYPSLTQENQAYVISTVKKLIN